MSDSPMVRLESVTKGYGSDVTRVDVLRDLDLEVARGELLAVIGPSGVGKSTLLHLVGLLDRPESGTVELDGAGVGTLDGEARAGLRNRLIGFVFQHHHLLDELDALDNVALPLRIGGWTARRARGRAAELIDMVGLVDRSHHFPDQLSGGEQQRVAVARALAAEPRLLLADEPTGNLDTDNSWQIMRVFESLNEKHGQTILMITHNPEIAGRADRIIHMRDGRIVDVEDES